MLSLNKGIGGPLFSPIIGGAKAKGRSLRRPKETAKVNLLEGYQETLRIDKNLESLAGRWAGINRSLD